jgi:glyoxylase-like metal-dependent hydrolase (beta-lactamase superfamily II)
MMERSSTGRIMEIAPDVHLVPGVVGTRPLQLYFLQGSDRRILLDTGCASDPEHLIFPYLRTIGLDSSDIDMVINTHSDLDHCGGNHTVKKANPLVQLTCGEQDRKLIENPKVMWDLRYDAYDKQHGIHYDQQSCKWILGSLGQAQPIDYTWRGGERLHLGSEWYVEIHHTPGHSAGHLSIFDPRSRTMMSGDAVQGSVYLDIGGNPALCPTYVHVDSYLSTIQYLESLSLDRLATCHWPLKEGDQVRLFLEDSRRFVQLADRVLLAGLAEREQGATLRDLITYAGPLLGAWPRLVDQELVYALAGHMDRLVHEDRVIALANSLPTLYKKK